MKTKVNPKNQPESNKWLNLNVFAFGLTSLLSDMCHEMATAILPQFMQVIGASAAALGFIEGTADAISSFTKLGSGYHSDKIGHRKSWTVFGYLLTAISKAVFAFAITWPTILIGRVLGWFGRGIRGPLRDAMLADSVSAQDRGKAFGFHRASDTIGAVLGPLAAFGVLSFAASHPQLFTWIQGLFPFLAGKSGNEFRIIFILTLVPGLLSVASILFLVSEKKRLPQHDLNFWKALRNMPKSYRNFLLAVGVFGMADFAPTLMILRASSVLEPWMGILEAGKWAALFYVCRNIVYAIASYPIGKISARFSRSHFIAAGYFIAALTFIGFAIEIASSIWFFILFGMAGVFIAWEDTMEGVAVRDYVRSEMAGTAYGILGVVNGIGDFWASLIVGILWTTVGASWGFIYAAVIALMGALLMIRVPGGSFGPQSQAP